MIRSFGTRLVVVISVVVLSVIASASPSSAVDYRLEIVTGSFTSRIGERVILTVAEPQIEEIADLLDDPAATAIVSLSKPLTQRTQVAAVVAGGEFDEETRVLLSGPVFAASTFNDQIVYQLNLPTGGVQRDGALRITREGLRALRITVTRGDELFAQANTFLNVVANRTYTPLPVFFVVDADGAPALQPDGTIRLGDSERERLRDLRDLIYRKPPAARIGVRIRPDLFDGLARSSEPDDQQLREDLFNKLPDNDILVATFRPTSVASYAAAALKTQFEAQLLRGETLLDTLNGADLATRNTWVTNEPIDAAGIDLLRAFGVTNVVVVGPAVDAYGSETDAARPYAMRSALNGVVLSLADSRYAQLLDVPTGTAHESAVAIAAEIVAQRESIAASAIGAAALANRQVVLSSAAGVPAEPLIATTLLRLLRNTPQVSLRQLDELAPSLEGLARIQPPTVPVIDVLSVQSRTNAAISAVEALREVLATNDDVVDTWIEVIDVANDTALSEQRRNEYLQTIVDQVESVRSGVVLPNSSFTFGSRDSSLRIGLSNTSGFELSVRLQFSSPTGKLSFTPDFVDVVLPANGQREVVVDASARSNGLIPVELVLMSKSGTVLDVSELRVRVNAIAGLGRGVSVVFLVLLGAWWFIHARRSNRKKKAKEHPALRSKA
ncbi:MAG: hypothetical protein RLZ29_94 [Actinomycetota bacterium]